MSENKSEGQFNSRLFAGEDHPCHGGLRTKGHLKKSENGKPLITVITAVLNGEKHLEETIKSVIEQTYDNIEYIIVDGISSDGTLDVIRKYEDVIDYWVSESDEGVYEAWNNGVTLSSGDWISFIGSDDCYEHNAIKRYVDEIQQDEAIEYISSRVELVGENGEHIRTIGTKWDWSKFRKYMNVAHVGSFHSRKLFLQTGLFNEKYKIAGDYDLLYRLGDTLNAGFVDHVTAKMRCGGVSDGSIAVLLETALIKLESGKRINAVVYLDMIVAIFKMKLRKLFIRISINNLKR